MRKTQLLKRTDRVERARGRAGVEQRKRRLKAEPLCRRCKAKGFITLATVWDHILPLVLGGTDDDENGQPLCDPCHVAKTAEDFGYRKRSEIGLDGWPVT
jgi:5-methylcytosine-specific restriction enzyme A